ncbi:MAG: hypothetical protein MK214_12555 [Thalassotalea sp.]|nr:hypothetical protein [Thalassotalea sp.]
MSELMPESIPQNMPEQQQQPSKAQVRSGRRSFIMVCVVFLLPIVIAKLALEKQWLNYGVTNQGQLLDTPVSLADLGLADIQSDKQWLIVYRQPSQCEQWCMQSVNALSNTYIALGKDMTRVTPVILSSKNAQQIDVNELSLTKWIHFSKTLMNHELLNESKVFVVDPLGNVVLSHKPPTQVSQLPSFGKAIVADMKKLLKYSRVG